MRWDQIERGADPGEGEGSEWTTSGLPQSLKYLFRTWVVLPVQHLSSNRCLVTATLMSIFISLILRRLENGSSITSLAQLNGLFSDSHAVRKKKTYIPHGATCAAGGWILGILPHQTKHILWCCFLAHVSEWSAVDSLAHQRGDVIT